VRVDVADDSTATTPTIIGIKNNDAAANLSIIGGRVRPTDNSSGITLIDSQGVLTVKGLTVDMANAGHAKPSTGIVLRAPGSSVTGSTIVVSNNATAEGINVQATASKSTVEGNTFIAAGNGIGVQGDNHLFSSALSINNFLGNFTSQVLPP
jgi:nitrous oxidase accessory protein NosD